MRARHRRSAAVGFQFNCCAIKEVTPLRWGSVTVFQFNCCAIKGNPRRRSLLFTFDFNSTVVRLKVQAHESHGYHQLIFQFNCCAIKGRTVHIAVPGLDIFQFNCCAIKGVRTPARSRSRRHISIQLLCD